ncbi:MAG TPA: ATP-grasp domain-containing protein [Blastocatellia bacterium]|nr:ATP-grasp domain-containing protein [Blastocatellia bacterium]
MNFVYPQSLLDSALPDEMFQDEATALSQNGHGISLIDSERLASRTAKLRPAVQSGVTVVYRGWMLSPTEYENLESSITAAGAVPLTAKDKYLATHYLPNWYSAISDLTPETVVLPLDVDWEAELSKLGWEGFFVKDYVKSLKTSVGSLIKRPEDIRIVAAEMEKYRGTIEGGLCVRRVEDFVRETERRYFVIYGQPYSADRADTIPEIVHDCASRINSKFFSVDVVCRTDGNLRVVEIGDGQVSDLVGWPVERFVEIWTELVGPNDIS